VDQWQQLKNIFRNIENNTPTDINRGILGEPNDIPLCKDSHESA